MKKIVRRTVNATTTNITEFIQKLHKKLQEQVIKYMVEVGFTPDGAEQYSRVTVKEEEDRVHIEVGAELDYDELEELCEVLDSIVNQYGDAYFEPVTSGIIDSYIWKEDIN